MKRKYPKYVTEFADRHGKYRLRFRRKGQKTYYFKSRYQSDGFWDEYNNCLQGKTAPHVKPGFGRARHGTIEDLVNRYYRSPEWQRMKKPSSRKTYRGIINRFVKDHADKRVAKIKAEHLDIILGKMNNTPAAANNLRKVLNRLFSYAVKIGMRSDNPALLTKPYPSKGEGFHTWTEEEIEQFEATHPIGSKARLAMAILLWTGQRRSDAIHLGRQHIKNGKIRINQQKTGKPAFVPVSPELQRNLDCVPSGQMTFLVTQFGKPFTPAGFGNWFRKQCKAAGLEGCSPHGLRKAMSRRLAEAGVSHSQGKAITGHKSDRMFSHYAAEANQEVMADKAMANLITRLAKNDDKPLKKKG